MVLLCRRSPQTSSPSAEPALVVRLRFTRCDSRSGYIFFPFACRLGHARLRHFSRDTGACRFVGFLLGFLLHRTSTMTSPPTQCSSIQDVSGNPRQMPPQLTRPSSSRSPAKLKAQADAGELARTRTSRIALSRGTHHAHGARLHVLNMKCALKGVQLQTSTPKLDQRHARLREKQSLSLFGLRKPFQAMASFITTREQDTETRRRFSGIQVHHRGGAQQRDRYRSDYRHARRNPFLRRDDRWQGRLCHRKCVATQNQSEQHDEPFVHHQSFLPSNSCSPPL
jgi:hypothetical protein